MHTEVSEVRAGETGSCPGCGRSTTIPAAHPCGGCAVSAGLSQEPAVSVFVVVAVVVVVMVCSVILLNLLFPAVSAAPEAARRATCQNNMKQIGLAMHNYHDIYGTFPPAYVADENGEPMHSWRVLILPYLEEQILYDQYNFDEPWDSPGNLALVGSMPDVYRCPTDSQSGPNETNYVVITGPGTVFEGNKAYKFGDITDGTSCTILIAEVTCSGINWMEPRDLDTQKMIYRINAQSGNDIGSAHPEGTCVGYCDGSVRFLVDDTPAETLKARITRAGGEPVPDPLD